MRIQLGINPKWFQDNLVARVLSSDAEPITVFLASLVVEQFESLFEEMVKFGEILRFKVEWPHHGFGQVRTPISLKQATEKELCDLGYFSATLVTTPENAFEICLGPPIGLRWLETPIIKQQTLKTIHKQIIQMRIGLQATNLTSASNALIPSCKCPTDLLVPYIDGVWDIALRFVCKICGKTYFCECFREALGKHYQTALEKRSYYAEHGWPHKFIRAYEQSRFRKGICHLCRDIASDLFYCHPMYGSKVMVHYGPYIMRTAIEKGISQREAENEIRDLLGIPRIGEGWISEVELLNIVRDIFSNEKVIHQASPDWLGPQRLDIYIPLLKIAIEYQGRQHYEPVEFFGGKEGFRKTQERDRQKAQACAKNDITLIYFRYDQAITREIVKQRLNDILSQ